MVLTNGKWGLLISLKKSVILSLFGSTISVKKKN